MSKAGKPRWLDDREARAWRGLIAMQGQLQGRLGRQLQRDAGLSEADYEVLVHLSEAPEGRLRPFELGSATSWEKSRVSHHLTRMEARGLVERVACPTDNRGAFIVLTDVGRSTIAAAAPKHVEHVRRDFIDALTPDQLDTLAEIAEAVLAHLDELADHEANVTQTRT